VGISFVDEDGARRNLDAEAPAAVTFDRMRAHAYEGWNRELQRIRVAGGTIADKRTFYTAFYHALLHPNVFEDVDGRYRGTYDAATTLEYGVADFALSLMAKRMGLDSDADRWLAQSLNYRNLLDPDTKWIRPRNGDGSWYDGDTPLGFDPAHDQTGYHEGNAW